MDNKIPRILIVDDDASLLASISDILQIKGFEPACAQSGGAALAYIESHNIDAALIDLRLNDMSGLEVLRSIKARSPETECILLTGYATQLSAIEAIQAGAFGYFQKPFDVEQILLSIQRAAEKRQSVLAMRESERFAHATVDALSSHLAILDETGVILAVNHAWREFAESNSLGMPDLNVYEGTNYLSVCETSVGINSEEASAMAAGIRAVISGKQKEFSLEYPCHSPNKKRWFNARVTRFPGEEALRVVVAHENITGRVQAEEAIHQRIKELELLYESGLVFSQLLNPKEIGQKIINLLREKLDWHHSAIRLYNPQNGSLELLAFDQPGLGDEKERSAVEERFNLLVMRPGDGLSGWAFQNYEAIRSGNVNADPRYVDTYPNIHSGLYIPLKSGASMLGVISIESEQADAFSEEDEQLIATLANQAANAFENARLYEEISSHVDTLEQRVAERTAEIEATRQRLELAVNAGQIGVWEANLNENVIIWDNYMHLIHGTSPHDFDNSFDAWWRVIHPQDIKQSQQRFQEALELTGLFEDEHRILRPDGSVRHVTANAVVLYDADHKTERMVGVNVDVTERVQAEEAMRHANAEMKRALRVKDEFLANMSHELRTPLNAVMGISESLLEQTIGALNEKQQKYIFTINESGEHLLTLINDILDLSKIEAGRLELNITDVSIKSLFESSFRMVKEMAQKKNIAISFGLDERVHNLRGDERRLKQMLVNLLSNAVKFTPVGGKAGLEVAAHPDLSEVTFTVWDSGIGISEADMPRLFQSFVQLDSSLAREYSGTGLGLTLVMQMARMHGGNISVQSEPGNGSHFTISLPWIQADQNASEQKMSEKAASSLALKERRTGRILLVEDTDSVIMLLRDYLEGKGYLVLLARDGLSGVEMAVSKRPDLILMDVQMPGMDGFEATEQLRAHESLRAIPIVALTALAMPGDRERCLAAGMNDYISKPICLNELMEIIERRL